MPVYGGWTAPIPGTSTATVDDGSADSSSTVTQAGSSTGACE